MSLLGNRTSGSPRLGDDEGLSWGRECLVDYERSEIIYLATRDSIPSASKIRGIEEFSLVTWRSIPSCLSYSCHTIIFVYTFIYTLQGD